MELIMNLSIYSRGLLLGTLAFTGATYSASNDKPEELLPIAQPIKAKIKNHISKIPSYTKDSANYLFSSRGVQDIAAAYCLGMGLTAIHELGHALTSKMFYGTPIDLTLGSTPYDYNKPYLQVGGIKLGGFNPATGYAQIDYREGDHLKQAAIGLAGPVCGALASWCAYKLLKKKYPNNFYLSKTVALYGLFNHTLGVAGLAGIYCPGSDGARIAQRLSKYFNQK